MQVDYMGRKVEAKPVDFVERKEGWNEYQIMDGKILKIKLVVTGVLILEGEKNPDGSQAYLIQSTNIVAPVE